MAGSLDGILLRHLQLFAQWACNPSAGGAVSVSSPYSRRMVNFFVEAVLVPGRCMGTSILLGLRISTVVNIHSFGFTAAQVRHIGTYTSSVCQIVEDSTCCSFGILMQASTLRLMVEVSLVLGKVLRELLSIVGALLCVLASSFPCGFPF